MAKISCFSNPEDMIMIPNRYDVYFIDMDAAGDVPAIGKQMR
jgi:hypothetical protein